MLRSIKFDKVTINIKYPLYIIISQCNRKFKCFSKKVRCIIKNWHSYTQYGELKCFGGKEAITNLLDMLGVGKLQKQSCFSITVK